MESKKEPCTEEAQHQGPAATRKYSAPKLVEWGRLDELTQGGGGAVQDPFGLPGSFTNE